MTTPTVSPLAHIVVGVDESPSSRHALATAARLGAPTRATITVVHVRPALGALGFSPSAAAEFDRAEHELDDLVRADAAGLLDGYAGPWDVAVRTGNVAQELLAVADEVAADLVVVGHRGRGPLRDAVLGSVASAVVHHSRRSVLVAVPPA
jgi:nucleotide-binding universal stress UspA family protein